ncbi:AmmeMemoRadiSam system radical SAM enzyme, partial [Chloroflexota bacterium]
MKLKFMMLEAKLYEKLPGSRVQCNICQWHCRVNPGRSGVCQMYQNQDSILYNLNYAQASSVATDPIEKKPLFHFFPGSLVFSLGSWGCNFHCQNCQNWGVACPETNKHWLDSQVIQPHVAIDMAKRYHCQGIAWTYNEPTIWFEYTLDSARLAKENKLYTVYVTNGYMSPEALDTIGPYLDVWRVDIKGFTDTFYQKIAKIPFWRGILEVAERAKVKWNIHIEVVTNIIPTINDDDQQLMDIARWIHDKLGELTPWHVTRFYPQHYIQHLPPTPISTLEYAYNIGHNAGLKFVYIGNVSGHKNENTFCYTCGKLIIRRFGY